MWHICPQLIVSAEGDEELFGMAVRIERLQPTVGIFEYHPFRTPTGCVVDGKSDAVPVIVSLVFQIEEVRHDECVSR